MQPFKVHILGCGSALPTLKHNSSAQVVEVRGKLFLLDCGEGTQVFLRRSHISFAKLQAVFITHLHGDHCFGLIGLISTLGLLGRTAPLHVYAPVELESLLQTQMKLFCYGLDFEVVFHAVDTTRNQVIFEDRSLTIETIPLEHRIPCCGYLFRERPSLPHIRREAIDFWHIPLSQINNIKQGADWMPPEGEIIANQRLTTPADAPRSYAYCSDTRYIPTLHELLEDVNLLYHESTYDTANRERANQYWHSTARDAAVVARDAHVHRLLLGHYSARYEDEEKLLNEAREVFPESYLTDEGMTFDVI